ncbi:hypothetical protein PR202_gb11593 [Eleusine coracana subsp. coracana]|uniref:Uncharacterized protein n=1 Tax=Eleusine coracana subsp. coracana TaxID=191504 RepID=A0AAV5EMY7_ELECO|nr:hypothetical protein PR202_gb11593 [Eleusine coracana subsp. coracana]
MLKILTGMGENIKMELGAELHEALRREEDGYARNQAKQSTRNKPVPCCRVPGHGSARRPIPGQIWGAACRFRRRGQRQFKPSVSLAATLAFLPSFLIHPGRRAIHAGAVSSLTTHTSPLAMASAKAHRDHHHQHQHRAEASCPATSVAVAAARASDSSAPRGPRPPPSSHQARDQQLRRSAAFPPRRHHPRPPQRCGSERNIRQQHRGCGEVAGGTAAGCAAVCCCFPCVMVEVVVLATVRAPAALCRRAARARRIGGRRRSASAGQAAEMYELLVDDGSVGTDAAEDVAAALAAVAKPATEDSAELEKEVWARFYGAGFWRSPSQLGDDTGDRFFF